MQFFVTVGYFSYVSCLNRHDYHKVQRHELLLYVEVSPSRNKKKSTKLDISHLVVGIDRIDGGLWAYGIS